MSNPRVIQIEEKELKILLEKAIKDCREEVQQQAAKYAQWVVEQFREKNNIQLLMQMPGKIERGECEI